MWAFIGMLDDGWLSDVEVSVVGSAWQQNQTLPLITHYARIYQWAIGALSPSALASAAYTVIVSHCGPSLCRQYDAQACWWGQTAA